MFFDEKVFELDVQGLKSSSDVLKYLSDRLEKLGIVKSSYKQAVLNREEDFPTGISFGNYGIAIPHTDVEHVIKPQIGVMTLHEPVKFVQMASKDIPVEVNTVFILALKEAHSQIDILQKLMELLQNTEVMEKINHLNNSDEDKEVLEKILIKEVSS
ncbi:PTS sugar transporter subunit IIA [Aerococcaceae bacterium 50-4]